jgi:hypothetical protein
MRQRRLRPPAEGGVPQVYIRNRLVALAVVVATLAIAAPVASASAAEGASGKPYAANPVIPCYPYPAFCGPNGQPWLQFFVGQLFPQGLFPPGLFHPPTAPTP